MRGFTIVEVLIAIVIFGILITGLYEVLNVGDMTTAQDMGLLDLQQQARQALDGMTLELRQSRPSAVQIPSPAYLNVPSIQFVIPVNLNPPTYFQPSQSIIYYLNWDPNLGYYQLIREHPAGVTKVLANNVRNITDLSFLLAGNIVEIRVRLEKTTVRGRNLCFPFPCNLAQYFTERVRLRNE